MAFVYQGDQDLEAKAKKAAERISENMHIVANEPSLALYRLQEHVRKALPPMVERRVEVTKLQHELQGRCYDVEYALSVEPRRRVSYKQLEALWEILNKNRSQATGYNKTILARELSRRMWETVAETLNFFRDGATKDWRAWNKYWNDYKSKLKRVVAIRASHQRSGGDPSEELPLSELENKFLQILGDDFGSGIPKARVEQFDEVPPTARSSGLSQQGSESVLIDWSLPGPSTDVRTEEQRVVIPTPPPVSPPIMAVSSRRSDRLVQRRDSFEAASRPSVQAQPSQWTLRGESRRRVSYKQLEALWEILNKNRSRATGYNKTTESRELSRRMWKSVAETLNSLGDGATKDWKAWCKYWNDYKSKLKRVVAIRASHQRSGGDLSEELPLSEMEKKFLLILGDDFGSGIPKARVEPLDEAPPADRSPGLSEQGSESVLIEWVLPGPSTDVRTEEQRVVIPIRPVSPPIMVVSSSLSHRLVQSRDSPEAVSRPSAQAQPLQRTPSVESRIRRVNYKQLEALSEILNKNRSLVTGNNRTLEARKLSQRMWESVAETLNFLDDGPTKDWKAWCKYWLDYKSALKSRVAGVRASHQRTVFGGTSKVPLLSEVEKKFLQILGYDFGSGIPRARVEPLDEAPPADRSPELSEQGSESDLIDWSLPGPSTDVRTEEQRVVTPTPPPVSPHTMAVTPRRSYRLLQRRDRPSASSRPSAQAQPSQRTLRVDSRRRVSYRQLETLWEMLNKNKSVATGYNKTAQARELFRRMWKSVAETLNSLGDGATKDWKAWCKYWNDYKSKLKFRVAAIRASHQRTSGDPSKVPLLSEMEKKFLLILGDDFGSGIPKARVEPLDEAPPADRSPELSEHGSESDLIDWSLPDPLTNVRIEELRVVIATPPPVPPPIMAVTPHSSHRLVQLRDSSPAASRPSAQAQPSQRTPHADEPQALVAESREIIMLKREKLILLRNLVQELKDIKNILNSRAVKSMDGAATSFMNIQEMLKQSIFLKQQLKYEEARRNKKDSNSVYKRLSAHIVLDLPDLSEFSMVRETTNRIENMMAHARGSTAELHRSHTTLH